MVDLSERTLMEALIEIRLSDPGKPDIKQLIVTEAGVSLTRERYATDPEFREIVWEQAAKNPAIRKMYEQIGCVFPQDEEPADGQE